MATRRGAANTYVDYWLFTPSKSFTYLGNYPIFKVDAEHRRLSTYELGAHAGMIYEAKEYSFVREKITLMKSEKQEATAKTGVYRKTTRKRVRGVLRVVHSELVTAPRPSP